MKKIYSIVTLFLLSIIAYGQVRPKGKDWFFYDLTYDVLVDEKGSSGLENNWRSNGHSFNFIYPIHFGESNFGMGIGAGFSSHNFHSNLRNRGVFMIPDSVGFAPPVTPEPGQSIYSIDTNKNYNTNKLTVQYIDIPLELRFQSKQNDKGRFFRFYVGAKVGIRVNGYTKFATDTENVRNYHMIELSRFRYGYYARVGYGPISLYGYYQASEIFGGSGASGSTQTTDGLILSEIGMYSIGISIAI